MELKIYNSTGALKLTASPNSTSTVTGEVMGEYAVSAAFTHTAFVQLDVNDYVLVEGVKYKLKAAYKPVKKNTQTFSYQVKFYAPIHDAEDALFLYEADGDTTTEFSYDGGPREHLQLWVDNMNRIAGGDLWSIGTVITGENRTIDYRNVYCWEAAFGSNGIAATYDTELWADGYVVNLCKASRGEIVELGYQKGLTQLQPEENGEMRFFTRLFPLGSTRNIDPTKYGFSRLQLPSREKHVDRNVDLYGVKEAWEEAAFADIYPKYVGSVTSVRSEQLTNEEGREYTVYYFKDSGMTFNPNDYEIPEYTKMLAFQTGDLAGRGNDEGSFEANWHADTQEWEIINVYPDEETQLPGGMIAPQPGDTYIPWNFRMPDEYVTAAEEAYRQAVDDFLASYSFDPTKYTAPTDRHYIERNAVPLMVGQNVRLLSDEYFTGGYKDTRITKVVRKLNDLCQATLTCTDKIGTGWKTSVDNQLSSLQYKLSKQAEQAVIDIIKTTDTKTPSDWNVFSALKSLAMFLRKDKDDTASGIITFLKGLLSDNIESQDFTSGPFGTGFIVKRDPKTGKSYIEADEIYIRLKAYFDSLQIKHLTHVGGRFVGSPASMKCTRVEKLSGGTEALYDSDGEQLFDADGEELHVPSGTGEQVYRCYFNNTDGERTIYNEFDIDDLAQCREFNVKTGVSEQVSNQYYWRKVVGLGDDYIDLSITDCDSGSTEPKAGDEIVTIGNKTKPERQHVFYLSAYDDDAPCIKLYSGINDYSMLNKELTVLSPNADKNLFTGKVVIKSGSTGFKNFDDAPDMDEIEKDIAGAKEDAENALTAASNADKAVGDLSTYVDGAFKDGVISESEAAAIEKYINIVNNSKQSTESAYNVLYTNPYLSGEAKTSLLNAKINLFGTIENLINSINTAIEDSKTTIEEKADVDAKFALYNDAMSDFETAVENANKAIQEQLKSYSDEAQRQAAEANAAANNAIGAANAAEDAVSDLNVYVDGAFKDGIITETEAQAIEKYINTVNETKATLEATYNKLYANPYLEGTAKTNLLNAKITLFGAIETLINSINTAIADSKTTVEEKNDVDAKYTAFISAYASFNSAVEDANKAIQDKIKELSVSEAVDAIEGQISEVTDAAKNDIAVKMGYDSYADMVAAAEKGETVINGGKINTTLIEAQAIVTTALIASAIRTAQLDVNGKFIVEKDGTFHGTDGTLTNMILTGAYRSPFKSGTFSWGGGIIATPGLQDNNNVIIPSPTQGSNLSCSLPFGMEYDGFIATILNENYNGVTTNGNLQFSGNISGSTFIPVYEDGSKSNTLIIAPHEGVEIQGFSDGTVFKGWVVRRRFKTSSDTSETYYTISVKASPTGGGTVSGGGRYPEGSVGNISATPNTNYRFVRWQDADGNQFQNPTIQVAWTGNNTYTAYFEYGVTQYTVTLLASPTNGGTVSGGGTYEAGAKKFVSASPNQGYIFERWSDGEVTLERMVTWDANKTLTAYFIQNTVVSGNIFTIPKTIETGETYFKKMYPDDNNIKISSVLGTIQITGTDDTSVLQINLGLLTGKIKAGAKYRLSFLYKKSSGLSQSEVGFATLGICTPYANDWTDPLYSPDCIDPNGFVMLSVSEEDIEYTREFVAQRGSTSSDALCIIYGVTSYVSTNETCITYIKNLKLEEI